MGRLDLLTKDMLRQKGAARDIINLALPGILTPNSTLEEKPTEAIVNFFDDEIEKQTAKGQKHQKNWLASVQRLRDVLYNARIVSDSRVDFVLIGIDNQAEVDYAMPARTLIMNVMGYAAQMEEISRDNRAKENERRKKQRKDKDFQPEERPMDWTELASGIRRGNKLIPIVTIIVYWNAQPWGGPRHLQDLMDVPPGLESIVDNNELLIVEPARMTAEEIASCTSDLKYVFDAIRNARDADKLQKTVESDAAYRSMDPTAAHIIAEVCGIDMGLLPSPDKGGRINMVAGVVGLQKRGEAVSNIKMLEQLTADGILPPEKIEAAKGGPTERVIDLMGEQTATLQLERDNANRELDNANRELDNANRELDNANRELDNANRELGTAKLELAQMRKGLRESAQRMHKRGMSVEEIAEDLGSSGEEVRSWLSGTHTSAQD